ncbi:MAG: C1 family peptidase [Legionellaceae bacterium]|nr:C1 family peptidase [Legionellaceae bacterium]
MFKNVLCSVCLMLMSEFVFAEDVNMVGTIDIKQPTHTISKRPTSLADSNQRIVLLKIDLSNKAQQSITERIDKVQHGLRASRMAAGVSRQVQLDMNGVPVLNQGSHGTCVTFAITAAIDAVLNKGDYISQLCQLELGRYLENNTYTSSGWNGSWGRIILSQMDMFGIVPKSYQRTNGCGGLTDYPLFGEDPIAEASLTEFHQMSEPLSQNQIAWSSIMEAYQVSSDQLDEDKILSDVKKTLNAGDRLTFGVLLLDFDQGTVGAVGTHNEKFDSWILTPDIANDMNDQAEFAGHEMIITGYDDDAIAKDAQGRSYQGLLTLRNSWGSNIGDTGNFYMSYDYFKALMLEVQRIRHLS